MPRRHPAWDEFIIVAEATYPDATCRHCSATLRKCQPSRNMLRHLSSCPQLSDAERTKWSRHGEPATKPKRKRQKRKKPANPRSPAATQESVVTEMSLSQSQPTMPFSSGVSNADKDRFQAEIARGFYAAGLPFRTIEVPRMRRALTVLQPDMEKYLPNRKALAGRLLTQEYDREKAELIARLRDEPTLGLISDGWTSVNKDKVINYVVVSPLMRPLLWCTRICGEDEQTAEYVASEIGDVIDEINEACGEAVVVSVTTDNAPVMQKAWEILEAARPIFCNGCSSHALNLILEEVLSLPWMASALSRSVTLVKFIRNRLQLLARFRKLQKEGDEEHRRALRLPVPTRWYSSFECIKSVLDNRRTVGKLFRQSKFMKRRFGRRRAVLAEVQDIVADKGFWKRIKLVQTLVEPIVDAIVMLEQDTCCISMVYWQFSQLQLSSVYTERISGVPMNVHSSILASIQDKWRFVHTDTMGISFLLDQTKSTSDFVDNDLAKTVKSIKQLAERIGLVEVAAEKQQIAAEADEFYLKKSRWSAETKEEESEVSPMAWWVNKVGRAPDKEHYYPLLAPLAARVFAIPTSSAASERSWSIHDFIHTKRRNRLSASRVEKLVFIYCNAGSKDAKANIFYKLGDEGEDEDDGETDADGGDQDSEGSSVSSASSGGSNRAVEDFSLSYEGSEEQKHEG